MTGGGGGGGGGSTKRGNVYGAWVGIDWLPVRVCALLGECEKKVPLCSGKISIRLNNAVLRHVRHVCTKLTDGQTIIILFKA